MVFSYFGYASFNAFGIKNIKEILDLGSEEHTILHWLTLLIMNRNIRLKTPIMLHGFEWLEKHFFIDIDMDDFMDMFVISGIAKQFGAGVPKYVAGMSGIELVWEVLFL